MGKIINNPVTTTLSGSLGKHLVFRQVGNRAFFVKKPVNTKPPTDAQRSNRHNFAEAQNYARVMMQDPELGEWYSIVAKVNNLKSAHRAAANDFLTKPEIESIDTKGYKGNVGDVIHITPKAYLKITRLEVTIYDAEGAILETGLAIKNELNFKYCAMQPNSRAEGSKIVLVAHDRLKKTCRVVEHLYG
ncbi:hypothetical protein [Chryseosolibacter indicus]|uniref:Uncharacterized protein n=1 Tax=Chryseosolibacter indicus TaxID=2782351 RepID=A0ABS5VXW3_9BACT|nr:hypothetical protein [Chryseosolibacter indicus]MBT1705764.1 hypothetical protein [Chryseosolibacter indicus]